MSVEPRQRASDWQNPAVIFANGYGDHYLNLPAIRALCDIFEGRLTLIGIEGAIEQITERLPLRKLVTVPMTHTGTGRDFDADTLAREAGPCDLFLSMNPWQNDALKRLITGLKPKRTIGFFDDYDIPLPRDYSKHSVDLAFDFPRLFQPDWRPENFAQAPCYPESTVEAADKILRTLPAGKRILCLHPDTLPEKMWPQERWIALIDRFLDRHPGFYVLIVGLGGIDTSLFRHQRSILPAYKLPIPISALLLSKAVLFVGVDSVFLHIADLYRVPAVGLFGATPAHEWGVRFGLHQHVEGQSGMRDIPVERALEAIEHMMPVAARENR